MMPHVVRQQARWQQALVSGAVGLAWQAHEMPLPRAACQDHAVLLNDQGSAP
jgi:hypothetical protein